MVAKINQYVVQMKARVCVFL